MWRWALLSSFFICSWEVAFPKNSVLGSPPEWEQLDEFQESITRSEFKNLLDKVYCPRSMWWKPWIVIEDGRARIRKFAGKDLWYNLSFSDKKLEFPKVKSPRQSVKGLKIALDPGHIGGKFSEMEGRHFSMGKDNPVKEGNLTLQTALQLKEILSKRGAEVVMVREKNSPVTQKRPKDFAKEAQEWMLGLGLEGVSKSDKVKLLEKRKEMLFYRVSEIRARARLINTKIRPDLVVCLHLNAGAWKDPEKKELLERNDYHILVNGCYMGGELAYDDQRFEMILRLLSGWHELERTLAESLSGSFSSMTRLPAFSYKGPNALKVGKVEGVWARNLLANRLYRCPVVFLEPYRANSIDAYHRILLGDYAGTRKISGVPRASLVREYAKAVADGILGGLEEDSR